MGIDMTLHILHTPMRRFVEHYDSERWCFVCRKRRVFIDVVSVPTDLDSYYPPSRHIECIKGHVDGDCFPGRTREWGDQ